MMIRRSEGLPSAPIAIGTARSAGTRPSLTVEGHYDQISLSGQAAPATFRSLAAALSQQVRTFNTTGKIQELRSQVASGTYRPDARETAARMLLLAEGE